jgi:hypothetical protein
VEKILLRRAQVSCSQSFFGSGFRPVREFPPRPFPSVFVTGIDAPHRPGDVEYVSTALLRLGNQAQCVAAERMSGKEKIEHRASSCVDRQIQPAGFDNWSYG